MNNIFYEINDNTPKEAAEVLFKSYAGYYIVPSKTAADSLFYCTCFGFHSEKPDFHLYREYYGGYQIIITLGGRGKILTNSRTYGVSRGNVAIIDCNQYHEQHTDSDKWYYYHFHFDGKNIKSLINSIIEIKSNNMRPDNFEEIALEFERIFEIREKHDLFADIETSEWICKILKLLLKNTKYSWYDGITEFINNNYTSQISLEEIAAKAHMHKTSFIRAFKKKSGLTPYQYIINLRIQKSRQLLTQNPEITIESVSEKCGFDTASAFCHMFFRTTGERPTEYKKRQLSQHI